MSNTMMPMPSEDIFFSSEEILAKTQYTHFYTNNLTKVRNMYYSLTVVELIVFVRVLDLFLLCHTVCDSLNFLCPSYIFLLFLMRFSFRSESLHVTVQI